MWEGGDKLCLKGKLVFEFKLTIVQTYVSWLRLPKKNWFIQI